MNAYSKKFLENKKNPFKNNDNDKKPFKNIVNDKINFKNNEE